MKKSINLLLILTTFLTGFVAFGSVTTTAYNDNQYPIACPSDFPYCDYKPSGNTANYCYIFVTNCMIDPSKNNNSTTDQNNTMVTNYSTQYYGTSMCYYYSYLCSTYQNQTPTNSNDIYYTDYCAYLNAENCKNIAVNQPKTNNNPNEQYIYTPIKADPLDNCYLNTGYCFGTTFDNNTASNNQNNTYYFENSIPAQTSNDVTTSMNEQYYDNVKSDQPYYQDYTFSDYYPISGNSAVYNNSNEMYYYAS
jgi:hypothetical protein